MKLTIDTQSNRGIEQRESGPSYKNRLMPMVIYFISTPVSL